MYIEILCRLIYNRIKGFVTNSPKGPTRATILLPFDTSIPTAFISYTPISDYKLAYHPFIAADSICLVTRTRSAEALPAQIEHCEQEDG